MTRVRISAGALRDCKSLQLIFGEIDFKRRGKSKKTLVVFKFESRQGHLPRAVSYYLGDDPLDNAIPTLDKNAMYLVYCHADGPSRTGAQKLIDTGFTNVYRLDSHYDGWVNAGYPVET